MADSFPNYLRNFATMMTAGLTVSKALDVLSRQSGGRLARVSADMHNRIDGGSTLSGAASHHPKVFSTLHVHLLNAAERSGHLDHVLQTMAQAAESAEKLKKEIVSALIYPTILLHAGACVPAIVTWFNSGTDAAMKQIASVLIPLYGCVFAIWLIYKLGNVARPIRWILDTAFYNIPVLGGTIRQVGLARFSRTFHALYSSGLGMPEAVVAGAGATGNALMEYKLKRAESRLLDGETLTDSIAATGVFSPMVVGMIATGEESGKLDEMFEKICENADFEAAVRIKRLAKVVPGLIYAVIAIWVGMLIIRMFSGQVQMINELTQPF